VPGSWDGLFLSEFLYLNTKVLMPCFNNISSHSSVPTQSCRKENLSGPHIQSL
jgi:hypothetical protein